MNQSWDFFCVFFSPRRALIFFLLCLGNCSASNSCRRKHHNNSFAVKNREWVRVQYNAASFHQNIFWNWLVTIKKHHKNRNSSCFSLLRQNRNLLVYFQMGLLKARSIWPFGKARLLIYQNQPGHSQRLDPGLSDQQDVPHDWRLYDSKENKGNKTTETNLYKLLCQIF